MHILEYYVKFANVAFLSMNIKYTLQKRIIGVQCGLKVAAVANVPNFIS